MNNSFALVNAKMKMADLLDNYHVVINLLSRLGISLGFGEKTVSQVCEENQVSLPLVLLVCNVYTQEGYIPDMEELKQCSILDVVHYLKASHEEYLVYEFPHIENHLQDVVKDWNDKYKLSILNFFQDYRKEVERHFRYEDKVVFPYIHQLVENQQSQKSKFKLGMFDKQHKNIEEKLHDFTSLIIKYIPADMAQRECVYMLNDIFDLSEDIAKHAILEEKILIPYIQVLESDECA